METINNVNSPTVLPVDSHLIFPSVLNQKSFFLLVEKDVALKLNRKNRFKTQPVYIQPMIVSLNNRNNVHKRTRKDKKINLRGQSELCQLICTSIRFFVDMPKSYLGDLGSQMSVILHKRRNNNIRISLI